jgi:hypothetical protein
MLLELKIFLKVKLFNKNDRFDDDRLIAEIFLNFQAP